MCSGKNDGQQQHASQITQRPKVKENFNDHGLLALAVSQIDDFLPAGIHSSQLRSESDGEKNGRVNIAPCSCISKTLDSNETRKVHLMNLWA